MTFAQLNSSSSFSGARIAASHGARVGIAEARFWGGTCVNVGCVPKKLLVQLGQVQAARVMKFTTAKEIATKATTIRAYVREAMVVAKAGMKVATKPREFALPEELKEKFRADPRFKRAFGESPHASSRMVFMCLRSRWKL